MDTADKSADQSAPDGPDEDIDAKMDTEPDEEMEQFVEIIDEDNDENMNTSTNENADELVENLDENSDLQKSALTEKQTVSGPDQSDKLVDENTVSSIKQPDKLPEIISEQEQPDKSTDDNTGSDLPGESPNINTIPDSDQPNKTSTENTVTDADQSDKTTIEKNEKIIDKKEIKEEKIIVKRSIDTDSEIKEDTSPSKKHAGTTRLCFEEDYDSTEETVIMTFEEVKEYLVKKVTECINSPVNPLFALQQRAEDLKVELSSKLTEYKKLCQGFQKLHENQEKFLRHAGLLPKVSTTSVSVSVDLPVLPGSIPKNVNIPRVTQQSALRNKELSITRVDNRTVSAKGSPSSTLSKAVTNSSAKSSQIECIDLTDDNDPTPARRSPNVPLTVLKHPAPLPPRPVTKSGQPFPPKPNLKISSEEKGIILQWEFPRNSRHLPAPINKFEIFGYQEVKNNPINTLLWKKIGNVDAMSLPMACTLTQFADGCRYHFTIRAVDVKGEYSHYSEVASITYRKPATSK